MRVQGYSKELEAMGVSVYDATGKVRSLFDIMKDASQVFDNLKAMGKDAQAYSLLDKLGGRQQGAVVASILQNIKTMESAYNTAMNSMGSATTEQERLMNSIDAKTNALKENILGMWLDISNSSAVKGLVDNVNELVTSLRNSENVAKGFGTAFNGITTVINSTPNGAGNPTRINADTKNVIPDTRVPAA